MPLYCIVGSSFLAICFLPYLVLALRRRVFSMIFVTLSILLFLLYASFFNVLPASYKHYLWVGDLRVGPFVFRPGLKPDVTWASTLLMLLGFAVFHWEEVRKKRFNKNVRGRPLK